MALKNYVTPQKHTNYSKKIINKYKYKNKITLAYSLHFKFLGKRRMNWFYNAVCAFYKYM